MARLPWPVWASLAANAILFAAKLVCYITTGSYAVAASLVDSTVVRAMGVCGGRGGVVLVWGTLYILMFSVLAPFLCVLSLDGVKDGEAFAYRVVASMEVERTERRRGPMEWSSLLLFRCC